MILGTLASDSAAAIRAVVLYRTTLATADRNPISEKAMAELLESIDAVFTLEEPDLTIIKNSAYAILEELADEAPMFQPRKVWLGVKTVYGGTEPDFLSVMMESGITNALYGYRRVAMMMDAQEATRIAHLRLIEAFGAYADSEGPAGKVLCWLLDQILTSRLQLKTLGISV